MSGLKFYDQVTRGYNVKYRDASSTNSDLYLYRGWINESLAKKHIKRIEEENMQREKQKVTPLIQAIIDNFLNLLTNKRTLFVLNNNEELNKERTWLSRTMPTDIFSVAMGTNNLEDALFKWGHKYGIILVATGVMETLRTDMEKALTIKKFMSVLQGVLIIHTMSDTDVKHMAQLNEWIPNGDGFSTLNKHKSGFIKGYTYDELLRVAIMAGATNIKKINSFNNLPGTCLVVEKNNGN